MASGFVAAAVAIMVFGFVEIFARTYPTRETWSKLRRTHGRRAVRAMRRRLEEVAQTKTTRILAGVLLALVVAWVASAPLLDKRWYEVVLDVTPYVIVSLAMLRIPGALRRVTVRIKKYEEDAGEDPDAADDEGDGGPTAIAL
jgi:hypothetical protein